MNVHLVTIGYGLADDLDNLVRKTRSEHDLTWHIFLHSTREAVVEVANGLKRLRKVAVNVYDYGVNRGVARSWNEGIINAYQNGADYVVIANDDISVPDGDLDALVAGAEAAPALTGIVQPWGYHQRSEVFSDMGLGFSIVTRTAYEVVGMFDENFMPMYYEDNDYYRRCALSGIGIQVIEGTEIIHKGSESLFTVPGLREQNNRTFEANRRYYIRKWGGEPGREVYNRPFDDARFGTRIADSDRGRPYWGYERDDLDGLVVI